MIIKSTIVLFSLIVLISCKQNSLLTDSSGNTYPIKKYGETIWMTENLRAKQDSSGNAIKYFFPNNDSTNTSSFGLLYNYETACKVCPSGWRLPTNKDWEALFKLNGANSAGNFKDNNYWKEKQNSNSSGFSIRPAGYSNNAEHNNNFEASAILWSSTKENEHFIWTYILEKEKDSVRVASQHPEYAFSVRCVKAN